MVCLLPDKESAKIIGNAGISNIPSCVGFIDHE
jgi:hypothetical protein